MDPLSLTASIVAVAGAGGQISLALISLANTVGGAAKSIKRIGDDIYVTCGILYVDLLDSNLPLLCLRVGETKSRR